MFVLNEITGKDVTKDPGFSSILWGNGLATLISGFIGGPAQTTYAENLGVLAITRQFSSRIIQGAAVIAIILGLFGKVGAAIQSIPVAVMGGICILLFGMIAAMGIRHIIEEKVNMANMKNLVIVAIIFIIGIGYAIMVSPTLPLPDCSSIGSYLILRQRTKVKMKRPFHTTLLSGMAFYF